MEGTAPSVTTPYVPLLIGMGDGAGPFLRRHSSVDEEGGPLRLSAQHRTIDDLLPDPRDRRRKRTTHLLTRRQAMQQILNWILQRRPHDVHRPVRSDGILDRLHPNGRGVVVCADRAPG